MKSQVLGYEYSRQTFKVLSSPTPGLRFVPNAVDLTGQGPTQAVGDHEVWNSELKEAHYQSFG